MLGAQHCSLTASYHHRLFLAHNSVHFRQDKYICNNECLFALQWRHNGCHSVSNHQPHDRLLNRLFRHRSQKISKLRVTGLCVGNSPGTGEFPAQMASYADNVSIQWRHHVAILFFCNGFSETCAELLAIFVCASISTNWLVLKSHYNMANLLCWNQKTSLIARFMGPTWSPPGADRIQVAPCWPHEPCYLGLFDIQAIFSGIGWS